MNGCMTEERIISVTLGKRQDLIVFNSKELQEETLKTRPPKMEIITIIIVGSGRWKSIYERGDHSSNHRLLWWDRKGKGILSKSEVNTYGLKTIKLWGGWAPSEINWPLLASVSRRLTLLWSDGFTCDREHPYGGLMPFNLCPLTFQLSIISFCSLKRATPSIHWKKEQIWHVPDVAAPIVRHSPSELKSHKPPPKRRWMPKANPTPTVILF